MIKLTFDETELTEDFSQPIVKDCIREAVFVKVQCWAVVCLTKEPANVDYSFKSVRLNGIQMSRYGLKAAIMKPASVLLKIPII